MRNKSNSLNTLQAAGFNYEDACALRRISMTLHRWHELECGDSNTWGSWAIVRGNYVRPEGPNRPMRPTGYDDRRAWIKPAKVFVHDDDGKPYMEHHHYRHGNGKDSVSYTLLPDRERGALKRLAAIMARYPGFASYVQGDPRGCALYVIAKADIPAGASLDSCYNRGMAVHK